MEKKRSYAKIYIIIFFILILLAIGMEYIKEIGTKKVMVKEYNLSSKKISNELDSLKIVHISDLHYGTTIHQKELQEIVNKINYISPDIVLLSGDLLSKNVDIKENEITKYLKDINVTIGKYAVSGNEDFKNNLWQNILSNSDFKIIDDTYELIYKNSYEPIILSGISTNLVNKNNISEKVASTKDFISKNENYYSILVLHEPDFIDDIDLNSYDLVLSGHSHNGYINLPIIKNLFLEAGSKKYYEPYYKKGNTDIYISNGLGTSSYSYRFNNRPSINFYRLFSEKKSK